MAEYAAGTGPGSVGNFSLDIRNFITRANQRVETVVKRAMMDIYRDVIEATPRDTGYAQSCWGAGSAIPPLNLARGGPGPYAADQAAGRAAIQSFHVGEGLVGYIFNNCRYIIPLEYGHSRDQAPAGMVRVVLPRFAAYVASAAVRS
jgi:hypothetical protein